MKSTPPDKHQGAPESTDAYLARLPAAQRAALEKLRRIIAAAAPNAIETISYQMPAFRQGTILVTYAAFRDHCSFFVMSPAVMEAHAADLRGYDAIPAGIRFAPDRPPPAALISKLVKARISEKEASAKRRR
jgi:uncharacterized protein YdhG (YjbR/CyaY superfamily)